MKKPKPLSPPRLSVEEQIKIVDEIHKLAPPVYKGKTLLKGFTKPAK